MYQNGIEIQVCADGKPVKEYGHDSRVFVEGRKGSSFTLKIRNNLHDRTNVVVLVDGINVVSGDDKLQQGYIVAGMSSYEIQGWRTSLQDVSTFVFKDKKGSYAKVTTGTTKLCGLISVVAYAEKKVEVERIIEKRWYPSPVVQPIVVQPIVPYRPYPHYPYQPWYDVVWCSSTALSQTFDSSLRSVCSTEPTNGDSVGLSFSASGAEVSDISFQLGAGWGPQKHDEVSETEFKSGSRVAAMELYYTDAKGLKKIGIDVKKTAAISKTPLPTALGSFCRPPA